MVEDLVELVHGRSVGAVVGVVGDLQCGEWRHRVPERIYPSVARQEDVLASPRMVFATKVKSPGVDIIVPVLGRGEAVVCTGFTVVD